MHLKKRFKSNQVMMLIFLLQIIASILRLSTGKRWNNQSIFWKQTLILSGQREWMRNKEGKSYSKNWNKNMGKIMIFLIQLILIINHLLQHGFQISKVLQLEAFILVSGCSESILILWEWRSLKVSFNFITGNVSH